MKESFFWFTNIFQIIEGLVAREIFLNFEYFFGGLLCCVLPATCSPLVSCWNWRFSRILASVLAAISSIFVVNLWFPLPSVPTPWDFFWPGIFIVSIFGHAMFAPRLRDLDRSGWSFTLILTAFLCFFSLAVVLSHSIIFVLCIG